MYYLIHYYYLVVEHDSAVIMVTEAKRLDMDQGVAQCAIEMDSAAQVNKKRKRGSTDNCALYGIVTTGTTWAFLCFEDGNVKIHRRGGLSISKSPLLKKEEKDHLGWEIEVLFGYILAIYNQASGCKPKAPKSERTHGRHKVRYFAGLNSGLWIVDCLWVVLYDEYGSASAPGCGATPVYMWRA